MVNYLIWLIFIIWLLVLTWIIIKAKNHYNRLVSITRKETLEKILETLMEFDSETGKEVTDLKHNLAKQADESRNHIKKIGLVRYNPFDRIGGEQSFVLSLLNSKDEGLLINFIYTREGLRVYSKMVPGKGTKVELSEEERKAIQDSQ